MNCYKVTFACGLYFYVNDDSIVHVKQQAERQYQEWKDQEGKLVSIENLTE